MYCKDRDVNLTSLYKICLTVNITSTCQWVTAGVCTVQWNELLYGETLCKIGFLFCREKFCRTPAIMWNIGVRLLIVIKKKEIMCWVRKVVNHCGSRYLHKGSSEPMVHCGFVLCSSMDIESHVLNVLCLNNAQLKYLDGQIFAYASLGLIKIGWSVESWLSSFYDT